MSNDVKTENFRSIGKPVPRKEDHRFLTGNGRYLDDIEIPGALHACFLRTPFAHARILSIDTEFDLWWSELAK